MDEEGLFKPNQRPNQCAKKLLGKVPLRWGTFTDYFIVYSYNQDDEGNSVGRNMDISPKEFVDQYTATLRPPTTKTTRTNVSEETEIFNWGVVEFFRRRFTSKGKPIPSELVKDLKILTDELKLKEWSDKKLQKAFKCMCRMKVFEKSEIKKQLKEKEKSYKDVDAYIGDAKMRDVKCLTPNGEIGKDLIPNFKSFMAEKRNAKCFTYHQASDNWNWLDDGVVGKEFKKFKKLIKEGKLISRFCNNTTHKLNGKEWHSLVVQNTPDCGNTCVGSLKLFGYLVSGVVYWFSVKKNRDSFFKYIGGVGDPVTEEKKQKEVARQKQIEVDKSEREKEMERLRREVKDKQKDKIEEEEDAETKRVHNLKFGKKGKTRTFETGTAEEVVKNADNPNNSTMEKKTNSRQRRKAKFAKQIGKHKKKNKKKNKKK